MSINDAGDFSRYYQSLSGLMIPTGTLKESKSPAMAVTHHGGPVSFEHHVRSQLEASRWRYFIFQELYRRDVWTRSVVDYHVRRASREADRLVDAADPMNPDIVRVKRFLKACNPRKSFKQLRKAFNQDVLVHGQGALYIERNRKGEPLNLWPLDARITFPVADLHGTTIMYAQAYNGEVQLFDCEDVIYHGLDNNGSNPLPISPLESLVDSIAMELNANRYNAALFENNLNIGAIFSIPQADDEEIERNKEYLRDQYSSPRNAHRPLILKGDAKLLRDGALAMKDINFTELIALARQRVCSIYGIPEGLLGFSENVNRSEGDNQEYTAYVNSILPLREDINETFSTQLIQTALEAPDVYMDVPLSSRLPTAGHLKSASQAADIGVFTFNEMREMVSQTPLANGDVPVMKIPGPGGFVRPDLTVLPRPRGRALRPGSLPTRAP
jgi:HK97 family phage portal protein